MGDKSKIEWTDMTWNPVTGCTKVSQGCKNCYAERLWPKVEAAERKRTDPLHWSAAPRRPFTAVRCHSERLDAPLRRRTPRRIFVNSMSDLFHEDVPDEFIDKVFAVMGTAKWHTYQVLTKRPLRALAWFTEKWQPAPEWSQRDLYEKTRALFAAHDHPCEDFRLDPKGEDRFDQVYYALDDLEYCTDPEKDHLYTLDGNSNLIAGGWPLPNVWLGVSVEDQATADERIPLLLQTPAAIRFVSYEPALGPIQILDYLMHTENIVREGPHDGDMVEQRDLLHWVIAGGESGPHPRPAHPDWFRSVRDQCAAAGVPFFFKQWGNWLGQGQDGDRNHHPFIVNALDRPLLTTKKAAGRLLDGRSHSEYPACG